MDNKGLIEIEALRLDIEGLAEHLESAINHRTEFMINSFAQRERLHRQLSGYVALVAVYASTQSWLAAVGAWVALVALNIFIGESQLERAIEADRKRLPDIKLERFYRSPDASPDDHIHDV